LAYHAPLILSAQDKRKVLAMVLMFVEHLLKNAWYYHDKHSSGQVVSSGTRKKARRLEKVVVKRME
jgi:hypothetical protein